MRLFPLFKSIQEFFHFTQRFNKFRIFSFFFAIIVFVIFLAERGLRSMDEKSKILIDSWTMGEVIPLFLRSISSQRQESLKLSMSNFLTSILLFDEVNLTIAGGEQQPYFEEFKDFCQKSPMQKFSNVASPPNFKLKTIRSIIGMKMRYWFSRIICLIPG